MSDKDANQVIAFAAVDVAWCMVDGRWAGGAAPIGQVAKIMSWHLHLCSQQQLQAAASSFCLHESSNCSCLAPIPRGIPILFPVLCTPPIFSG